jgi:hypothetical protein
VDIVYVVYAHTRTHTHTHARTYSCAVVSLGGPWRDELHFGLPSSGTGWEARPCSEGGTGWEARPCSECLRVNVGLAKINFVAIWVKERLTDRCCQLTGATAGGTQHTGKPEGDLCTSHSVTLTHLRTVRPFPDAPRLKRPAANTALAEQRQLCVLGTGQESCVTGVRISPTLPTLRCAALTATT